MSDSNEGQAPKSLSLYELSKEFNSLSELLILNGGELTPEMEARFSELDIETAGKVDGYKFMIDRLEAEASFWSMEADERYKLSRSAKSLAGRIKDNLKKRMSEMGKEEISGEVVRVVLSPTKGALAVDLEALPQDFKMRVEQWVADKEKIRAELEQFNEVPGARMEGGYSIRFYNVKPATVQIPKPEKKPKAKKGDA